MTVGPGAERMQQHAGGGQWLEEVTESSLPFIEILFTGTKCLGPIMGVGSINGFSFPGISMDLGAIHCGKV